MTIALRLVSLFCILASLFLSSYAYTCTNYTFSNHRIFNSCTDLPYLSAHLHWNYIPSTQRIEIAYRAEQTSTGWVAWAINPTSIGMVGSQALVAFWNSNGSLVAYSTPIGNYGPSMEPGPLSFPVSNITAEYAHNEMIIFAVVGPLNNYTAVKHAWQSGSSVSGDIPQMHPTSGSHLESLGTLDFLSG